MKRKPTKEQVRRWKLKEWEKNWDKELIKTILDNIIELWNESGSITAPDFKVLGYILGEMRKAYLLYSLIKLQNQMRILWCKKDDEIIIDYIPF